MSWTEQLRFYFMRELLSKLRLRRGEYDVVASWVSLVLGVGRLVFFMLCELARGNDNPFSILSPVTLQKLHLSASGIHDWSFSKTRSGAIDQLPLDLSLPAQQKPCVMYASRQRATTPKATPSTSQFSTPLTAQLD